MENIPVRMTPSGHQNGHHQPAGAQTPTEQPKPKRRRRKLLLKIVIIVVIIGAIATGACLYGRSGSLSSQIDGGKYQALFLTNGQVYFGKLKALNNDYFELTSIFYLQSASTDTSNPQKTADSSTDNVNLIKLGSEVHGPEDEMVVSKQQVLFFENLKADGRVSASIDQYLKK